MIERYSQPKIDAIRPGPTLNERYALAMSMTNLAWAIALVIGRRRLPNVQMALVFVVGCRRFPYTH